MIDVGDLMFEFGIIMLISFIGAALASKARQSVILGYILAGILIGPHMSLTIGGIDYNGLIQDTSFVQSLSYLGLTLLMFFVGLSFSVNKLKKTKAPAILLALINVGVNMFAGILLGFALGWPVVDTVFLAGVFAMSSAAITGKSLMEQNRMGAPETEFLLGMVIVENFLSMILLTIVGGLMFKSGIGGSLTLTTMVFGILIFYGFFIFLAILVVPRVVTYFQRIKSDELFVLFSLGLVFLAAAMAELSGVPAIIGAFFMGMVFSETKLAKRFDDRLSPFKDALVAVFFVSFGMLIDPAMIPQIIWIVLIAAPLVIVNDLLFTGALAYLLGFSAKGSIFMGASICGRGAESVMFASVGSNSPAVTKGAELNPFAGAFCFVMSVITPAMMKASTGIAGVLGRHIPHFMRYGGAITSRTLGKVILPSSLKLFQRTRRLEALLVLYFVMLVAVMITNGALQLLLFGSTIGLTIFMYFVLEAEMYLVVRMSNYDNLGMVSRDPSHISRYIASFVFSSLMAILLVAFFFGMLWQASPLILVGYFLVILSLTHRLYVTTRSPAINLKVKGPSRRFKPSPGRGFARRSSEPCSIAHEEDPAWVTRPSRTMTHEPSSPPPRELQEDEKWRRL
ncbi:MAG: cation:proton antiporter [Methanomassiliicoccales archaeon]|nr:cation:proton antiporter [Methanomassiliicoccales archaeon]